jgi:hypothetical protein
MDYSSTIERESEAMPGVVLVIARISFGRRLELMRHVRELARRVEFLEAGNDAKEKIEASTLALEIDKLYVTWGLREVRGLRIDGADATPQSLAESGPEPLFGEALARVKAECGLNETERKN